MLNKILNAYEMWTTGSVLSPGGTRTVAKGGKMDAFFAGVGISTYQNKQLQELYNTGNALNKYTQRKNTQARKKILASDNPYKMAVDLGIDPQKVTEWKKGASKTGLNKNLKDVSPDWERR